MAELLPDLGGTIARLDHGGRAVLRPAPPGAHDPLTTACFPLVPYANRIAHGRLAFGGETYQLPRNFGDHPHTLHGTGWQRAWAVAGRGTDTATLVQAQDGGPGWPWAYRVEQRFRLHADRLEVTLALTNRDRRAMPAGLGFHPYFPLEDRTRLRARAGRVWLSDAGCLPVEAVAADHFGDWAAGAPVRGERLIDNAYQDWDGAAQIDDITIRAQGARAFHLYVPPGEDFFCFEPVTHLPNALGDVLAPGETLRLAMEIGLSRAAATK